MLRVPLAGETSTDMYEIIVRDMTDEKETSKTKEYLNVAPNNTKKAVLKKETADSEGAEARNCSDRFENANPFLQESGELNMDSTSCEKKEKLPMDAETEMLSSVATKINYFFTVCSLEMD